MAGGGLGEGMGIRKVIKSGRVSAPTLNWVWFMIKSIVHIKFCFFLFCGNCKIVLT